MVILGMTHRQQKVNRGSEEEKEEEKTKFCRCEAVVRFAFLWLDAKSLTIGLAGCDNW
jgi:hypothetical protein